MHPTKQLVNLIGLSVALRLPKQWLRKQAEQGVIPGLRVGRQWRFSVKAVERQLARQASKVRVAVE
jgi:excisionase family DNA binding protein